MYKWAVSQEICYSNVSKLWSVDLGALCVDWTGSAENARGKRGSSATVSAHSPCCLGCSASGMIGSGNVCSSDNTQSNIGDQVEQKNAKLVQRHPNVVQGIKLIHRQMKPSAMPSMHPIVCEQEEQPPHEQDAIVDDGTPEQKSTCHRDIHTPSPMCLLLYDEFSQFPRESMPTWSVRLAHAIQPKAFLMASSAPSQLSFLQPGVVESRSAPSIHDHGESGDHAQTLGSSSIGILGHERDETDGQKGKKPGSI